MSADGWASASGRTIAGGQSSTGWIRRWPSSFWNSRKRTRDTGTLRFHPSPLQIDLVTPAQPFEHGLSGNLPTEKAEGARHPKTLNIACRTALFICCWANS
jgi:hypothetical protein